MDLRKDQIEFIKHRLSILRSDSEIQEEFRQKYGNYLPLDPINKVRTTHKEDIKEAIVKELNNPSAVPVAYSRVRLEAIQRGLAIAFEKKGRRSYAVTNDAGQTSYKEFEDIDHANIQKYLELSMKEEFLAKKLLLEKLTRNIKEPEVTDQGTPVVNIISGYDEDENLRIEDHETKEMDY